MIEYLIKRVKEKEAVEGGTIISGTAREKPQEGKVIAVGHGKKTEGGKVEGIYWLAMGSSQIICHLTRSPGRAWEEAVSERNGDKSRFGRLRKQKILRRKQSRELRKALVTQEQNVKVHRTPKQA